MTRTISVSLLVVALLFSICTVQSQAPRGGATTALPDGAGKEIVSTACTQCHALSLVTGAGYSREEWPMVFGGMVKLPADQLAVVADYLAKNFPDKPKPQAVIIPG